MTVIRPSWTMPGLMTTRSPIENPSTPLTERSDDAGAVRAQDARLRNGGQSLPDPDVEMVESGGSKLDEYLAGRGLGIGDVLVAKDLGSTVLVDANGLHEAESSHDRRRAESAGRGPRPGRRRRSRGRAVRGDRAPHRRAEGRAGSSPTCASRWRGPRSPVIRSSSSRGRAPSSLRRSATTSRVASQGPTRADCRAIRGVTRTRRCATRLEELGSRLGGTYRVLVDVERPRRSRGGRSRRRRVLRQEHDGDHAPVRLLGRSRGARHRRRDRADRRRSRSTAGRAGSASTRARPARSTSRASSMRRSASRTGRRRRRPIPEEYRAELGRNGVRLRHLPGRVPWNRGVEKRRGDDRRPPSDATPTVSLRDWLERDGDELVAEFDRLYVPRNDPRWLRRNALVAAGNVGSRELVPAVEHYAGDDDPMLRDAAAVGARPRSRSAPHDCGRTTNGWRSSCTRFAARSQRFAPSRRHTRANRVDRPMRRRLVRARNRRLPRRSSAIVTDATVASVRLEEVDVGRWSRKRSAGERSTAANVRRAGR